MPTIVICLDKMIQTPYSKVTIELKNNFNIHEIKDILSNEGETTIDLVIINDKSRVKYSLLNNRKFDLSHLKTLKSKEYVEKISV